MSVSDYLGWATSMAQTLGVLDAIKAAIIAIIAIGILKKVLQRGD